MLKKLMVVLTVLLLALGLVFAQGSKEENNDGGVVTLRFGWWGGDSRHEAYIAAANRYMELNPNVKIICEYSGFDGYREKLYTQLAGGNAPDLFQNHYTWLPEQNAMSSKAIVRDYNELKEYVDLSIYADGFLESSCVCDGKIMALPGSVNTYCVVADTLVLDKVGFDYEGDWTWDDFLEYNRKLKEIDPSYYFENGLNAGTIHMYWFCDYMAQLTGKAFETDYKLNYSVEELEKAFEFFKKYFDEGVIESLGTTELYNGTYAQNPTWINAKSGILFGQLSNIENYVTALGDNSKYATVIKMPMMKDAKDPFNTMIVGQCFSIPASCSERNAIEAAKFLNWMNTDPEAGVILKLSRGIPVSKAQNEALAEKGLLNPLVIKAQEFAEEQGQGVGNTVLSRNNEITKIGNDILSALAYGKISPKEAASQYYELVTDKLAELKD